MQKIRLRASRSKDGERYIITFPKKFKQITGWKPGDDLLAELRDEGGQLVVVIRKL